MSTFTVYIVGLLLVGAANCIVRADSHACFHHEAELQHQYYGQPADSYEIHVEESATLAKPESMHLMCTDRKSKDGMVRVNMRKP